MLVVRSNWRVCCFDFRRGERETNRVRVNFRARIARAYDVKIHLRNSLVCKRWTFPWVGFIYAHFKHNRTQAGLNRDTMEGSPLAKLPGLVPLKFLQQLADSLI
jgi:hypothetical protein